MTRDIIRDLGGKLILRQAVPEDTEALVAFNAAIHVDSESDTGFRVGAWTRDLMSKPHPTFQVGDFTIVEDTTTGKIVSSLNLISQTWQYAGISFKVGRPELVGTLAEYRHRGLVRAQFEVIHQWSAERGELLQAITGIPYYYRLFGYEMALNLEGGRAGYLPHIPKLEAGKTEPYRFRKAQVEDIPFLCQLYEIACRRSLVSCVWDAPLWRYEILGKSQDNVNRFELRIIESAAGEAVGYLAFPHFRWGAMQIASQYEVKAGHSWAAVTPSVVRYLQSVGESQAPYHGEALFSSFGFWLGAEHPVYAVLPGSLPRVRQPYAWYLRVPDLPAFLRLIAPELERRLDNSPLAGHTGELKITFYREGIKLVFEGGKIVEATSWKPEPQGHSGQAAFPGLTFLQLLFGYRSIDELKYAFPDCWTDGDEALALLSAAFPKRASNVIPVS